MTKSLHFPALARVAIGVAALCCLGGALAKPIIPAMKISVAPQALSVAPGASVVLVARTQGGEAMRLFVDWSVQEAVAGGTLTPLADAADGSARVQYTAPAQASGPLHIMASVRGHPQVRACASVTLTGAPAPGPADKDGCAPAP